MDMHDTITIPAPRSTADRAVDLFARASGCTGWRAICVLPPSAGACRHPVGLLMGASQSLDHMISAHRATTRAVETLAPRVGHHQMPSEFGEDVQVSRGRAADPRCADAPRTTRESRRATGGMLAVQADCLRGPRGGTPTAIPTGARVQVLLH